ncbi:hypothetical protein PVA45_06005 [Entomospira entomophila]|uniref:Uncharacterized protein n=1 Tax=Entomospira entomophila TaxID=2719988 RepID=A0A968G9K5_9SPIO|nr:hypothetical protein [Entomospira entomophilus]NIZ41052.1 hypothetical protein [Entomospira entomophilus]WDI35261.1 hypothetical protein PVA45_06005 [Entomospira entomophilus]
MRRLEIFITVMILLLVILMNVLHSQNNRELANLENDPDNPANIMALKLIRIATLEELMIENEETIRALERIENRTPGQQERLDKARERLAERQDEHARLKEQARVLESVMSEAQ